MSARCADVLDSLMRRCGSRKELYVNPIVTESAPPAGLRISPPRSPRSQRWFAAPSLHTPPSLRPIAPVCPTNNHARSTVGTAEPLPLNGDLRYVISWPQSHPGDEHGQLSILRPWRRLVPYQPSRVQEHPPKRPRPDGRPGGPGRRTSRIHPAAHDPSPGEVGPGMLRAR